MWVGGNSTAAMRRAARHDGWAPLHTGGFARASRTAAIESLDDLAHAIATVRALVTEGGRTEGGRTEGDRTGAAVTTTDAMLDAWSADTPAAPVS